MNTETLINATDKEVQPAKLDMSARPSNKKETERAKCGNGVCEVSWKPFGETRTVQGDAKSGT